MSEAWLLGRRTIQARAEIDLENTPDSFHAYAVPDGVDIRPGDVVEVHGVPEAIDFGQHLVFALPATVHRAGLLEQWWTAFTAMFELTGLYEVGFEPKETP